MSVKSVWNYVKETPELMIYFPDYLETQIPDRKFMYSIISTVFPNALRHLIKEAKAKRSLVVDNEDNDTIEIKPEIMEAIMGVLSQKSKSSYL